VGVSRRHCLEAKSFAICYMHPCSLRSQREALVNRRFGFRTISPEGAGVLHDLVCEIRFA
jgi:hypothetical protein